MPSVTSLRTAYFTCWIGPGRCVRASLNSGLICKSPTTRSKLIKSRMPNRPMSGLQRVAASETHINVLRAERRPKSPPQAHTDPASSPDAHASNANGRATETPTDAKAAANSEAKSNPTSVKPSQAHLVAPPPGRSLSIQYTNGYVYLGRPVPFTAGRVTRGKDRERKKKQPTAGATHQHQGNVQRLSCISAPPTATMATSKRTTAPIPSWANSALLHGDSTPSSARLISSSGLDGLDPEGLPGVRRAPPRGPVFLPAPCCFW